MTLITVVLSHFDTILGPMVFLHAPESIGEEKLESITKLFNLFEGGFNIHMWGNYKSANLFFDIPSESGRGKVEMLQISIVVDIDTSVNMNHLRELLRGFKKEISEINDCYKAFHVHDKRAPRDNKVYTELKDTFFSYFKSVKPSIEALKEAENKYQSLFEGARDAIIIFEEDTGKIIDINAEAKQILGNAKPKMIKSSISDLPFVKPSALVIEKIKTQSASENAEPIIIKLNPVDNEVIPLEINANRIHIGDNVWIQLICRDITERMIAKQKLEESERKYRELVEKVNSIILKWDFKGKVVYINDYGERFFGYSNEDLKGKHVLGTIAPETETSGRNLKQIIQDILNDPDKYKTNENENITRDGDKVWVSWTNSALRDERGNIIGVLSVGNDITYKRKINNGI